MSDNLPSPHHFIVVGWIGDRKLYEAAIVVHLDTQASGPYEALREAMCRMPKSVNLDWIDRWEVQKVRTS